MLKPPVEIFVAYGHDHDLRDCVRANLQKIAKDNHFRVKIHSVTDFEVRTRTGGVESTVHEVLREVDAAVVILSGDDYGIARKDLDKVSKDGLCPIDDMETRGRQNVVYELGYLTAILGRQRYYVISDPYIRPFANMGDTFRSSRDNIAELMSEFLVERLKIPSEKKLIFDPKRRIDYSNFALGQSGDDATSTLEFFDGEYSKLTNDEEKILYLYERIVFDRYLEAPRWWSERIANLGKTTRIKTLVDGLVLVREYMGARGDVARGELRRFAILSKSMDSVIEKIKRIKVAPVVRMVLVNYHGLALDKRARYARTINKSPETVAYLRKAVQAFTSVIELSSEYEGNPRLWQGYALFNRARALRMLSELDDCPPEKWMEDFEWAIRVREDWSNTTVQFPVIIREGHYMQYLLAKAARIEMKESEESGEFAINDSFVKEARAEFEKWRTGQSRMRIQLDLIAKWKNINDRPG